MLTSLKQLVFEIMPFIAKLNDKFVVKKLYYSKINEKYEFVNLEISDEYTIHENKKTGKIRTNFLSKFSNEIILPFNFSWIYPPNQIVFEESILERQLLFNKNFADRVSSWNISKDIEETLCEYMCHICIKTKLIVDFYQDVFFNYPIVFDPIKLWDENTESLGNFSDIMMNLMHSWGYFSEELNYDSSKFLPILSDGPNIDEYKYYFSTLKAFYVGLQVNEELIRSKADSNSDEIETWMFEFFISIMSPDVIKLIDYQYIETYIDKIANYKWVDNDDEKLIIKLISSIKYSDADKFLDHLISDVVKGKSRFIHMYDVIDDDNAQYYPFLSFWAGEKNKAVYMRLVAKLWEHSKYNLYYIPDGSTNIIDELIHTESFFYNNILHYNERSTYHFYSTRELLCSAINQDQFDFLKDGTKDTYLIRKNELLDVSIKDVPQYENAWNSEGKLTNKILQYDPKVTIESKYYESVVEERRKIIGDSAFTKSQKMDDSETVSKVEYHLYHPLSIVGINIDDELQISETTNIPAFLFAYINKYTDDKKFHALIGTLTDIGLEAFLFYFTGGASALGHLKHLKYLTNVGRSFKFSAEVSSKIRIFSGWHAGAEVLNLSTSVAFSVSNYIIATSNDSERVKLAKLVSKICFLGMLGSSGVSMYTNRKMVTAADEMFTELENLSNSNVLRYYNGMANEEKLLFDKFISHMVDISDSTSAGIQKFRTDLLNYLPENSTILSKLDITDSNAFSVSERLDFYFDFGRKLDRNGKSFQGEFWKKFNKGGQNTIDNWLNLRNANLIERLEIDVLSKTNLSNRIIQFASNTTYVDGVITLSSVYREINISRRINLMKNLSENRNTSEFNALMNLLAEKPKNLNFLDEALHAEKKAQYIRNYNEVLELILDNEFNRFQFNYLRHLNLKFVEEASKVFTKVCKIVNPTVQELRGLYDDTIDLLKNDLKAILS